VARRAYVPLSREELKGSGKIYFVPLGDFSTATAEEKNIGVLYFHLPQSNDPRSVLYKSVGGISELDLMGEEF